MPVMNIIEAVNSALHIAMEKDPTTVVFGEDVGYFGGVFRATVGLQEKFGEARCFDTPICEQGIIGFALGCALNGLNPIPEIQFADYMFPAYDQLHNEVAKSRYRSGGHYPCAMTIRTPYGGGIHGGHYHSQSPEAQYLHTPGIKIVMPSDPYEAKGLLLASIRTPDPIIFFEPKRIYRASKADVPEEDYEIPLGVARVARDGRDLTLIGWGAQHQQNMAAAEAAAKEGIDVEVIDLRTLNPVDVDTISASVQKTGKCVVAQEAPRTMGFASEISALIMERCFLHLEAPVHRCTGFDTPFSNAHEHDYMPDMKRVLHSIRQTAKY